MKADGERISIKRGEVNGTNITFLVFPAAREENMFIIQSPKALIELSSLMCLDHRALIKNRLLQPVMLVP